MVIQTILLITTLIVSAHDRNDFTAKKNKVADANGILTKITPETLDQLAPKVPEDTHIRLRSLLDDATFIKAIIEQEGPESDIKARWEDAKQLLNNYGFNPLPNSGGNFVFDLGKLDEDYLIKISGHGNRRELLTAAHNMRYGSSYDNEFISAEFLNKYFPLNAHGQPLKTYQTASRIAHGLLFNQFLKECPACDGVKAVQEYLVTLPGKGNLVDDKSCIVISKKETDIKPLTQEALKDVPVERVVCLWAGMRYAGGWNMNNQNVQINSNNELIWLDLEQPNTTQPHEVFHGDYKRWLHNVTVGEETLLQMLGENSPHAKAIEEAKKQNILVSKESFNNYINQLKNNSNNNG